MGMIVRPVTPADEDGFYEVRGLVYNSGNSIPVDERKARNSVAYAAVLDGRVVGGYNSISFPTVVGSQVVSAAGIAAVAVPPDHRGGIGTQMMQGAVRAAREEGHLLSHLHAFREPFYRRAGYETCGGRLEVTVRADRFPKIDAALPIRRLGPEDWPQLAPCHEAFTRRRPGGVIRTEEWMWNRITAEGRPLQIYAAGDPVEAYAVVGHKSDFWSVDSIGEVVWSTRAGYESLLGVLRAIAVNKEGLRWFEPVGGPMSTIYSDKDVDVAATHPAMFRAVNIPGLLQTLRSDQPLEFSLEVHDPVIPENRGPWRVVVREDECWVEPSSEGDVQFTERTFVQALLGMPSFAELAGDGWITGTNLNVAARAFPARNVYLLERY